ncbi:MAG: hypothetical protein NC092_11205 [Butyrivibrio sp.]|nr:hypothetical protein [Muribaculum sp.]MCM1553248.1 hypothetical protein [Butyrivibrio sp.]
MTREEMRIKRELKRAIEKDLLKPLSKRYGYKSIGGMPYCVHDDWLYTIYVSNTHDHIRMALSVRPIAIDEAFWEVFEMKEEADKQPFSFHVNAAFVPYSFRLDDWKAPITAVDDAEAVLEQAFVDANRKIAGYCEQLKTISDFKELEKGNEPVNHLNVMLCDIVMGDFESALARVENELSQKHGGGFMSLKGGDIYEYVRRYCRERL